VEGGRECPSCKGNGVAVNEVLVAGAVVEGLLLFHWVGRELRVESLGARILRGGRGRV
jgi:hypothetical protein